MLTIHLSGVDQAPKWVTTQRLIREALFSAGRLTRINRDDQGCNYREKGSYTLEFTPAMGGPRLEIRLVVE